jgi:nickel-type superoxide dismutase maturation protease
VIVVLRLRPVGLCRPLRYSAPGTKCPVGGRAVREALAPANVAAGMLAGAIVAAWWAAHHFERVAVTGSSMEPALLPGDRLLVRKTATVHAGDIVAAPDPRQAGRTVLKRAGSVGAGMVWLIGDNPEHSTDSRHFGPVATGSVEGKVVYRYAPAGRAGRL